MHTGELFFDNGRPAVMTRRREVQPNCREEKRGEKKRSRSPLSHVLEVPRSAQRRLSVVD
jgi:hypothetical protein